MYLQFANRFSINLLNLSSVVLPFILVEAFPFSGLAEKYFDWTMNDNNGMRRWGILFGGKLLAPFRPIEQN